MFLTRLDEMCIRDRIMAVCIGAAFCMGKWLYERKSVLWCIIGFGMMVWSFDTYQSFLAFYIGIVLISYICEYSSGMNPCGWREGILHVMFFVAGYVVSQLLAIWICQIKGGDVYKRQDRGSSIVPGKGSDGSETDHQYGSAETGSIRYFGAQRGYRKIRFG